jgi:hypothetical protein
VGSRYGLLVISIAMLIRLILAGCSNEPAPDSLLDAATTTLISTEVLSPTLAAGFSPTPTTPNLLASPTLTPTLTLPVLAGTPMPLPQKPITPDNVDQIQQLAMWVVPLTVVSIQSRRSAMKMAEIANEEVRLGND